MDQQELHISSMVVHARPEYLAEVKKSIEQLPGAEIHGESDNGKLVVVLETLNQGYITDDERDALFDLARSFDQKPPRVVKVSGVGQDDAP